jgi:hypothetical protein
VKIIEFLEKIHSDTTFSECDNNSALRETTELPHVQMKRLTAVVNERIILGSGGRSWPSASPSYLHCMTAEWTLVEEGMAHQEDSCYADA